MQVRSVSLRGMTYEVLTGTASTFIPNLPFVRGLPADLSAVLPTEALA